jgi:hypothetical protein
MVEFGALKKFPQPGRIDNMERHAVYGYPFAQKIPGGPWKMGHDGGFLAG